MIRIAVLSRVEGMHRVGEVVVGRGLVVNRMPLSLTTMQPGRAKATRNMQ